MRIVSNIRGLKLCQQKYRCKLFAQTNKYLLLFHVKPSSVTLCYKWEIHTTLEPVQHEQYSEVTPVTFPCTFETFLVRLNSKGTRTFRITVDTTAMHKQSLGKMMRGTRKTFEMFNKLSSVILT
jgi:hypothetical protein